MEFFEQIRASLVAKNEAGASELLKAVAKIEKRFKRVDESMVPAIKSKVDQIVSKLATSMFVYKELMELHEMMSPSEKVKKSDVKVDLKKEPAKDDDEKGDDMEIESATSQSESATAVVADSAAGAVSSEKDQETPTPTINVNESKTPADESHVEEATTSTAVQEAAAAASTVQSRKSSSSSSLELNDEESKQYDLIVKLDYTIQELASEIRRLEALEVDLDMNESEKKRDKLCEKLSKLYKRFVIKCRKYPHLVKFEEGVKLVKVDSSDKIKFPIKASANKQLNEFMTENLRNKSPPDYHRVHALVVQFNKANNLSPSEEEIVMDAKKILTEVITKMKNKRQKILRDNRSQMIERFTGRDADQVDKEDPALEDVALRDKLLKNGFEAQKKTEAIIEEFALKQEENKDDDDSGESCESDEESVNEIEEEEEKQVKPSTSKSVESPATAPVAPAPKPVEPIVLIPRRKRSGPQLNEVESKKEKPAEIEIIVLD